MTILKCPRCEYATDDLDVAVAVELLKIHGGEHPPATTPAPQNGTPPAAPVPRAPAERARRPSLESGITLERWTYFTARWTRYKRLSDIHADLVPAHLLECCEEDLLLDLHRSSGPKLDTMTEDELLAEMKKLAVRGESQLISRVHLRSMCQDHNEDIRHFAARVKGQANLCNYVIQCSSCNSPVSYAEEEICDQLCTGLSDSEIQKEVLARRQTQPSTTEDLIAFIEDREAGKRSQTALTSSGSVSKISAYKQSKRKPPETTPQGAGTGDICSYCGETGHGRRAPKAQRRQICPAFNKTCEKCHIPGHITKMCRSNKSERKINTISLDDQNTNFLGSIEVAGIRNTNKSITISHKEYTAISGWVTNNNKKHPQITVGIEVSKEDFESFGLPLPKKEYSSISRIAIADTGAMIMVGGDELLPALGLEKSDLIPVRIELSAANNSKLKILGGIFITVWGRGKEGKKISTRQLCYIQDGDNKVYLSENACKNLGLIPQNFPLIGSCLHADAINTGTHTAHTCNMLPGSQKCICPKREKPPPEPKAIPYPPTPENLQKLKTWILNRYRASTFNTCETQQLPKMTGPPLKLNVDPNATPVAFHTPAPVPIHWREQVKAQLDRDVKLGVIEPVPWGQPTVWCSRMVTVAKTDGSPRRTVDLQELNNASVRQTHHTPSPFHQAMSVPHNTKKTVTDAWNGYHSLEICEEDRHLTTFITPYGRYQYCSATQGFLASGDAYTRRFDEIISQSQQLQNHTKCVDDTLLWADDIETAFFQTCKFLNLVGDNGIILNPTKFQFAEDVVEFAGFRITPTNVQPSDELLDAIQNFPTPTDITGMRSWFGLVNQGAYAFSMAEKMAPFRDSLKPGSKFNWNHQLQDLFNLSKEEIVRAVQNGVRLFDLTKKTALITDYSKTGTGFSLMQKHCTCTSDVPTCCQGGWKLVFAGGQFNNNAESRYSPIEGECLAVVKALKKPTVRYFVLGCDDLIIVTDHKPLVKLLGDRKLEDIDNPRLLSMKEKTLLYRFTMKYIPGKKNHIPDAASRFPTGASEEAVDDPLNIEHTVFITGISSLSNLDEEGVKCITWPKIKLETLSDPIMLQLLNTVEEGFCGKRKSLPADLKPYESLKNSLTAVDGVILYKNRVVIPQALRERVIENLHSAHQGVSSMISRAQASVFWPGITSDIHKVRDRCFHCNRIAPSQPAAPPTTPMLPEYPFQSIAADYCTVGGTNYLVSVDRYSNWPSIQKAPHGAANSKQLISELKKHCSTFGIPEELSSDGGPQFTSSETQKFMNDFGIRSRISSVAFPHSNCRAEIGVKSMKRLILNNTGPGGSLDTDKVLRGILQYRNTPDPVTGFSPAEVVFGRQLRDFTPVLPGKYRPREEWCRTLERREEALTKRHNRDHERWSEHTQQLPPLKVGDNVYIQNQTGNHARRWDKSGVVVEVKQHDQYIVKKDGSGIATLRNRRFLRKFTPYNVAIRPQTPTLTHHITTKPDSSDVYVAPNVHNSSPLTTSHTAETYRGNCQQPILTPNRKFANSPVQQRESVSEIPTISGNDVAAVLDPRTEVIASESPTRIPATERNTVLPRKRLDLNPGDIEKTTRSGRISKPVERYQAQ